MFVYCYYTMTIKFYPLLIKSILFYMIQASKMYINFWQWLYISTYVQLHRSLMCNCTGTPGCWFQI